MEKALDMFRLPEETTQPGRQGDTSLEGGRNKRRAAAEASLNLLNALDHSTDKRWTPYDPSELVISTCEGPSQRYPLVHQACAGKDGLDFSLLRKSGVLCSETLINDMYTRIEALHEKVGTLTKALENKEKENGHLQERLNYFVDIHGSLLHTLDNICALKDKAETCMAAYEEIAAFSAGHPPQRARVPLVGDGMDTQPTDTVDIVSAIPDVPQLSEDQMSGFRVRLLGKHMVGVHISASGYVEKPLHAMHILHMGDRSAVDGIYYFQKQFLDIINSILPKRLKISSLAAWNYTMRNFKTEVIQAAAWDDSMEAREAKDLAKGPRGVILLTHNTMKDAIESLTDRTQGDRKWERVPGKVNKQMELRHKTDDLAAELKRVIENFYDLMNSNRDVSSGSGA